MTGSPAVLLVEDSETQALKFSYLLENEGLHVHRTASAEDALQYMRGHAPDLLVVDYHLPGMGGDELCRRIRMNSGTESIPVLILTDDEETEVARHGFDSGADDHVTKSADPDVLLARVQALLRSRRIDAPWSASIAAGFRAQRILVVDDSATYRTFLAAELGREGYLVEAVGDGESGLAAVNRESCDCIVVDLVMPGMDGIALCRKLDSYRRASRLSVPVLMVTGKDTKEDMMAALEAGADDFVSKSNDSVILKARIRSLIRRKLLRDEHNRILNEFRNKELEVVRERAEKEAALERANLAAQLEDANRELRETQAQLVHSAKMASLGELVAGVAHEVNNPLAFAMSHAGTIEKALNSVAAEVGAALSPETASRLDKARRRVVDMRTGLERVKELVAKLRTFSRLDEGDFKLTDVRDDIQSTLVLLGHRLADRICVKASYADDNTLYCAPSSLNQVLMNLLSNAIDAVGERGDITISTRRTGNTFEISVADSGAGVAPEVMDRIYEPFFTTKDVGQGTGLGLAIAYRIVERHHGSIEVHNRDEGGAEFIVRIPTDLEERIDARHYV